MEGQRNLQVYGVLGESVEINNMVEISVENWSDGLVLAPNENKCQWRLPTVTPSQHLPWKIIVWSKRT